MGKILRLWGGGFLAKAGVSGRAPPTNGKGNINKYAKRPALSSVPKRFTKSKQGERRPAEAANIAFSLTGHIADA